MPFDRSRFHSCLLSYQYDRIYDAQSSIPLGKALRPTHK